MTALHLFRVKRVTRSIRTFAEQAASRAVLLWWDLSAAAAVNHSWIDWGVLMVSKSAPELSEAHVSEVPRSLVGGMIGH